jgi:pimeloyl-ACP methyl ester carboxylesterase
MTAQPDPSRPTIVLVHGAFADASGFAAVIRALQERGFRTVGFGNPLRGIAADAAYLADFLRSLPGPLVLVGHSYGGAVVSAAATGNDQVKALVFFSGWLPDEGESIAQLFEQSGGSLGGAAIRPLALTGADGSEAAPDLYLDSEQFPAAFAADVDRATAEVMAVSQRPWSGAAFGEPSGPPAWKTVPSWYLLCTEDQTIPPGIQRFMAERANARIQEVPASHASMVSQPEAATQLILQAADATALAPA